MIGRKISVASFEEVDQGSSDEDLGEIEGRKHQPESRSDADKIVQGNQEIRE